MANKRDLKKAIHHDTGSLFAECIMFKEFISGADQTKVNELLDEILTFQYDYLRRVSGYRAEENKTVIRVYFKDLSKDLVVRSQCLFDKIYELNK